MSILFLFKKIKLDKKSSLGGYNFVNETSFFVKKIFGRTEEEWNNAPYIDDLSNTNITIYLYSKIKPSTEVNYWYYDSEGKVREHN